VQCQPAGCPFGQSCGFKNGVRSCVEQPGRCNLIPASRFVSFDGAAGHTTPTGVYVVAAICDVQHPDWFRLLAGVGETEDRPAVTALHLFASRVFVTVKRDKKVWVNGIPATLPTKASDTLSITESQGTIWITQKPHLEVGLSPAGEVTVTVTRDMRQQLCGTCGNYDGDAANDRRGPDGKMVESMAAAVKAWRAPDFTY
ncbi:FCGBP protein, partial [Atlantisia rogersi]|nr:FCGBP protein [Atlantisia rogersi]